MSRLVIYQLFVRHFSNSQKNGVHNGSIEQNGCGTFTGITDTALQAIAAQGFNTVWLTGILDHATGTNHVGIPADETGILKGKAGSPYAVRDYYNVSPDLASNPALGLSELRDLIFRAHKAGLRCLIDFIPNHVARSYHSAGESFGESDDPSVFFSPQNDFYYLPGEGELTLPDGSTFEAEKDRRRVTGNNIISDAPSIHDWYETVKLNYGYDFTQRETLHDLPPVGTAVEDVPPVWRKMRSILLFWAELGIGGVRCDMAHMVPTPFWSWVIAEISETFPHFTFIAEAYETDPMGCLPNHSLNDLIESGFHAYYDQDFYHHLKRVTEGHQAPASLNEIFFRHERQKHGIRYLENHDEVRTANPDHFGTDEQNIAACAAAWLTGTGPVMLYNGQEVGEPAIGASGHSGDDGRSSIFDYIALPELQKWTNNGSFNGKKLSPEQTILRNRYSSLIQFTNQPSFATGETYGLNYVNEHLSEQGLFVFARFLPDDPGSLFLVITCHYTEQPSEITVHLPAPLLESVGLQAPPFAMIDRDGQLLNAEREGEETKLHLPLANSTNVFLSTLTYS